MANPYASPLAESRPARAGRAAWLLAPGSGPAVVVAVGMVLGAVAGTPLIIAESMLGFYAMLPGALLGGAVYRWASRKLPEDRAMRLRHWLYAATAFMLFTAIYLAFRMPAVTTLARDLLGRGFGMAVILSFIVGTFAAGVSVSGVRRARLPS